MIERIGPDDARMRQVYDLGVRSRELGRPWFVPAPYDVWLSGRREVDPAEPEEIYGVAEDGAVVASSMVWVPRDDNVDKVYASIDVDPPARRRGHGTALVEHLVARTCELGRHVVLVDATVPGTTARDLAGHPTTRFAEAHGFRRAETEVVRHLDLPVDVDLLDTVAARAAQRHGTTYRIETHVGPIPAQRLPGLAALKSLLAVDAPSGEVDYEPEAFTPERLAQRLEREERQGMVRLTALAIHADGTVAAYTHLVTPRTPADRPVGQGGTLVHRDHRGRRLGLAVKAANLARLQRELPGRPYVFTANAETNRFMVGINERLGFRIVELAPTFVAYLS